MYYRIKSFWSDETGAVTVDWVILTAGLVSLAIASSAVVIDGTEDLSGDIDERLKSQLIKTNF